jgi:hypothetical protein
VAAAYLDAAILPDSHMSVRVTSILAMTNLQAVTHRYQGVMVAVTVAHLQAKVGSDSVSDSRHGEIGGRSHRGVSSRRTVS